MILVVLRYRPKREAPGRSDLSDYSCVRNGRLFPAPLTTEEETLVRITIAAAIFTLILSVSCSPLAAQTTRPVFLFSLEDKGVPSGTIHAFRVNASTGAITEVPGSPFN